MKEIKVKEVKFKIDIWADAEKLANVLVTNGYATKMEEVGYGISKDWHVIVLMEEKK